MKLSPEATSELTTLSRANGWLNPNVSIQSLSPAGEGNMNLVFRGQLSDNTTLIFKQSLPFVARYPQIAAPEDRLHYESLFYASIGSNERLSSNIPTIVGFDTDAHVLCMHDLGESSDFVCLYEQSASAEELQPILTSLLEWLSHLHQTPVSADHAGKFSNLEMRRLNHEHIFVIPLMVDNGLEFPSALSEFAHSIRNDRIASGRIQQLGSLYLGECEPDNVPALLHGDFYPASWLRSPDNNIYVIDPEFCFCGPPEFDVGVLWAHLTFAGLKQRDIQDLLAAYRPAAHFSPDLARQFAAIEIIRRLLGVAQLPLNANESQRCDWLDWAFTTLRTI